MAKLTKENFNNNITDSVVHWGEYGNDGEDLYVGFLVPYNVGDSVTKDNYQYKVTDKDWDFDNNTIYFTLIKQL